MTTGMQPFEIVNEIGHEAYRGIEARVRTQEAELEDPFSAALMACCIALGDVLAPTIAASKDRTKAADMLIALCMKRVRELVEPAVRGGVK